MIDANCVQLACDVAVRRALEVASKRMLTRATRGRTCLSTPPYLVYTCLPPVTDSAQLAYVLRDAWSCLPEDMEWLVPSLESYVRLLLASGTAHDRDWLVAELPITQLGSL